MSHESNGRVPVDCDGFRERISAAHDGKDDLGGARQLDRERGSVRDGAWRRHALSCPACGAFEADLSGIVAELAVLRGTPVPDLWPAIRARAGLRERRSWRSPAIPLAAAAAGALATWGVLSALANGGPRASVAGLERALAVISAETAPPAALARIDGTPERLLLAHIGATKGDER